MSTEKAPLIHLALAAILKDIDAVQKDKRNADQGGFMFRGIDDVYNALHPIFAAHGVVCVPVVESLDHSHHENANKKLVFRSFVTIGWRFIATDGSVVEAKTVGEGSDFADKATAKALSVAHKYLLLQTFLVPTRDLVDGDYESTADPHGEIEARNEAARREAELQRQQEKLNEKREGLQQQVQDAGGLPAGAQQTQAASVPAREPSKATPPPEKRARAPKPKPEPEQKPTETPVTPPAQPQQAATTPPPAAGSEPAWAAHQITELSHPKFINRLVGDLTKDELTVLKESWCNKPEFQEAFKQDATKATLRSYLLAALEAKA